MGASTQVIVKKSGQLLLILLLLVLWAVRTPVWGHGELGNRLFVEPVVTEDAFIRPPHLNLVPSYRKEKGGERAFELGAALRIPLYGRLGLELEGEWVRIDEPSGGNDEGFKNPTVLLKYRAFQSVAHEAIATVGLALRPSFGSENVEADESTLVVPGLFYAKGFGELPNTLAFLKPLSIQGDIGLVFPITNRRETDETLTAVQYNFFISYSLPYFDRFVKKLPGPLFLRQLHPFVGLSFLSNVENGGGTTGLARPGLIWAGEHLQLGGAAQFPITGETGGAVGIIGILTLFLE